MPAKLGKKGLSSVCQSTSCSQLVQAKGKANSAKGNLASFSFTV